jgi:PAS domain S-box-containing protein
MIFSVELSAYLTKPIFNKLKMLQTGLSNPFRNTIDLKMDQMVTERLHFKWLPDYAQFLKENRLSDLAREQFRLSGELNIPLLDHFAHLPTEKLLESGARGIEQLLEALSANRASRYIEKSVQNWVNNKIPEISRNQISPEDIALLSFIRCKIFRDSLPYYTQDLNLAILVMEEVTAFTSALDLIFTRTLLTMHQELYEQAQQIAHIGSWSLELASNSIVWSNELFRIYELEPQKKLTYDLESFNHPEDAAHVREQMKISIETARPVEFYYRILLNSGKEKFLHARCQVVRDEEGRADKMFGIVQDVSTQKKIEREQRENAEQIRLQEERYYKMTDEVEDYAILLLSPEGVIQNWNNGAEKIKGYKSEEIIGKNFRIFYPPEDRENKVPERLIQEAVLNGKASHEGWRLRKDQTRFWGNIVITCLHNKKGEVIGFSKVTRDLTQKKLAEDNFKMYTANLEIKNRELELKNQELESFSYIASHDLQEPVRKISIWTNRIEETENISENIKDSLSRIQKACTRMQKLIQGVLQYSQTDTMQLLREWTDLDLVLDEVLNDLSEVIDEKKIEIERYPLPTLKLVRLQFIQLFSNIISNAIKYRHENVPTKITITSSLINEEKELPGNRKSYYKITVSDNGIGFIPEYADKMFELFRRLESGHAYSGTGIGLAICKKIVMNHQGTIQATGQPGKGASFEIRLPVE